MSEDLAAELKFEQHHLPGLMAGEYRIEIAQTIEMRDRDPATVTAGATAYFAVAGNRFTPLGSELVQVFPPENGVGEYERTFAHVVLANPSMPWTRSPVKPPKTGGSTAPVPSSNKTPGLDEPDVASWLAVLLLDEKDGVPLQPVTMTLKDLRPTNTGSPHCYSYFTDPEEPPPTEPIDADLDLGEHADDPVLVLDLPLKIFWRIAPSLNDLHMLAHVRLASIAAKPARTSSSVPAGKPADSKASEVQAYAVVVGNRTPATGRQSRAYLVSLENLSHLLPGDDGTAPVVSGVQEDDILRLACLATWAFTSTGSGRHFESLMSAQAERPSSESGGVKDYSLRLPEPAAAAGPSPAEDSARKALRMGYVPLAHRTRDGGGTVSWYRGPLTPYRVGGAAPTTYSSADAAARYDPDNGLFDMSYAAAWQLGRLMGLQAKAFSVALHNWRRDGIRKHVAHLQQNALAQSVAHVNGKMPGLGNLGSLLSAFVQEPPRTTTDSLPPIHEGYAAHAQAHREAMAAPGSIAEAIAPNVPDGVAAWLGGLNLLNGVPFHYLVPDEAMLPNESIRFFAVDQHWINALIDGACSIGRDSTALAQQHAMQQALQEAGTVAASQQRAIALGLPVDANSASADNGPAKLTGFLMRSSAVKFWPNLQANGYGPPGQDGVHTPLGLLRFEHLADDVVLGLFQGETLVRLDLHEPPEGVHFGLDDAAPEDGGFKIDLRVSAAGANGAVGSVIRPDGQTPLSQPVPMRGDDVLRAWDLAVALKNLNRAEIAETTLEALPSSELGMQMIKGVARVRWDIAA